MSLARCPEIVWTIDEALEWIRSVQPAVMESGWCLMLGGGVLNQGVSGTDLDVIAYPRTRESRVAAVVSVLGDGTWSQAPSMYPVARVYSFEVDDRAVEVIFQTWFPQFEEAL